MFGPHSSRVAKKHLDYCKCESFSSIIPHHAISCCTNALNFPHKRFELCTAFAAPAYFRGYRGRARWPAVGVGRSNGRCGRRWGTRAFDCQLDRARVYRNLPEAANVAIFRNAAAAQAVSRRVVRPHSRQLPVRAAATPGIAADERASRPSSTPAAAEAEIATPTKAQPVPVAEPHPVATSATPPPLDAA